MIVTQRDLYTVDTWLTTMTNAAAKHGISKQFGGCVSSMFLHSVSLPSVHSARVGADYIPSAHRPPNTCTTVNGGQEDQLWEASSRGGSSHDYRQRAYRQSAGVGSAEGSATLGRNSLVPWSLGILPYKDATFTGPQKWSDTTCLMPAGRTYTMPEWYGLQGECCSRSFSCHESHAITQDSAVLHIHRILPPRSILCLVSQRADFACRSVSGARCGSQRNGGWSDCVLRRGGRLQRVSVDARGTGGWHPAQASTACYRT